VDSCQAVARDGRTTGVHKLSGSIVRISVEHEVAKVGESVHVVPRGIEITVEIASE